MAQMKEKQIKLEEEFTKVSSEQNIWKPKVKDVIVGKIIKRQKSNFGSSFVLESDDKLFLLPNHKVLEDLLSRCFIGDTVKIVCVGTTPSKQGNDTMLYEVFVKKPV